jgi:hypothetical protein
MAALVPVAFSLRWVWRWRSVAGQVFWETEIYLLPSLVLGNLLNAVSGAIFGVTHAAHRRLQSHAGGLSGRACRRRARCIRLSRPWCEMVQIVPAA